MSWRFVRKILCRMQLSAQEGLSLLLASFNSGGGSEGGVCASAPDTDTCALYCAAPSVYPLDVQLPKVCYGLP